MSSNTRSKIFNSIDETVGNTPLVRLNNIKKQFHLHGNIISKLEFFNPLGSVKDRIGLAMINTAEKKKKIRQKPKIKTKSGTKKRFKTTASGKVVMFPSCKRHNLSKRSKKMKRAAKGPTIMSKQDSRIVKKYMNVKI